MAKAPDHVGLWIFFNELRYKFETLKEITYQVQLSVDIKSTLCDSYRLLRYYRRAASEFDGTG
jgi:hypothetical protein